MGHTARQSVVSKSTEEKRDCHSVFIQDINHDYDILLKRYSQCLSLHLLFDQRFLIGKQIQECSQRYCVQLI